MKYYVYKWTGNKGKFFACFNTPEAAEECAAEWNKIYRVAGEPVDFRIHM